MARVPGLGPDDLPPDYRQILDDLLQARGFVPNLYAVMAHIPGAMSDFIRFTTTLRADGALPAADKELVIIRVGELTRAKTIVAAHRGFARSAGLAPAMIEALAEPGDSPLFDARQRAMLSYADRVTAHIRVDDETWRAVRAHLDDAQLVELTLVVACYNMVARFLEPLQVDLDRRYGS